MKYDEFLKNKHVAIAPVGIEVTRAALPKSLEES